MDLSMLLIKAIIAGMIFVGIGGFFIWKFSKDTIDKDLNRLNKETEAVRAKQAELNDKIKQASEELSKRRAEADALVAKMKDDAENKAKEEREKLMAKARQEGEEIIVKANHTRDEIRKQIIKEFNMKAVEYTGMILSNVLSSKSKSALDESLAAEFIENLAKIDMEMIGADITTAEVISAAGLSDSLKNRLSDVLQKKLNRTIQVSVKSDPAVLSGLILKFGSLSLDGSLKNMIDENSIDIKEKLDKGLL